MYVFADCKGLKQGGALYVFADCKGRGIKCCLFDLVTESSTGVVLCSTE